MHCASLVLTCLNPARLGLRALPKSSPWPMLLAHSPQRRPICSACSCPVPPALCSATDDKAGEKYQPATSNRQRTAATSIRPSPCGPSPTALLGICLRKQVERTLPLQSEYLGVE